MSAMDVDTPVEAVSPAAATESLEATVEELERLLSELDAKPLDVKLLRRQLVLVRQLNMQDEEEQAVVSLSEKVALHEGSSIYKLGTMRGVANRSR